MYCKNSVRASVDFYFKGEKFSPSMILDIDVYLEGKYNAYYIYTELGKSIGLDAYRHEFDVMEVETIVFSQATGLVVDYVQDGTVAWQALEHAWQKQSDERAIAEIANKCFGVENINGHPKLAAALLAAFRAGAKAEQATRSTNTGLNEGFYG